MEYPVMAKWNLNGKVHAFMCDNTKNMRNMISREKLVPRKQSLKSFM